MPNTPWPADNPFAAPAAPSLTELPSASSPPPDTMLAPAKPGFGPKPFEIIVDEPIRPVPDPSQHPYAVIAAVRSSRRHLGTGFLVTPRLLLTASHLFARLPREEAATVHVLFPGFPPIGVENGAIFDPANSAEGQPGDVAVLLLAQRPAGLMPIPLAAQGPEPQPGLRLEVSGYPDAGATQMHHAGLLLDAEAPWLDYRVNTLGGHSGAPVLVAVPGAPRAAVGLHVLGAGHHPGNIVANRGIRLDARIAAWIGGFGA